MSKYISRKKKIAVKGSENRELETLQLLNQFNSKLKTSAKRVGTFTADTKQKALTTHMITIALAVGYQKKKPKTHTICIPINLGNRLV